VDIGTHLNAPVDTDIDGCPDLYELGRRLSRGGDRNPVSQWDFFDVPAPALSAASPSGTRNKAISLQDVGAILSYVGAVNNREPNLAGYDYDSDFNSNSLEDGSEYDRTPSLNPAKPWRSGAPNGAVSLQDVGVALAQVGANCGSPP
jgi:hypothetical protein